MATESLHTKACSALVVFLFLALVTGLLLVAIPALASDVVFVDHGSVYDPPASSDKAYYPSVLYDESQFSGRGALHYYKMWYADAQGQDEAVTYSDDGMSWSSPVQTTGIMASGYHAKVIYIPAGYSAVGGTYYYKIWYWDSSANVYSINALRTADSADGENWHNDQILTQDVTKPLVTGDPSNWSAGSYGPVTILYHPSAANAGSNPFDYTFSMYYDATTGGQEAVALAFSTDGIHWTRYGNAPVLPHGNPGDWDSDYASHGTVIKGSDGTWRMWYSGSGPSAGAEQGIGYATSADGINWTKDPANPIFSIYQAVAWRSSRCYTPSVLYRSTHFDGHGAAAAYKMWFTGEASASGNRTIGYADAAVCPAITVSPSAIPSATGGLPYSQTVTAAGGTGPYTYSVTSGSLPSGLTLSPAGLLSGQILAAGAYPFTITATDSGNCTGSQAYSLAAICPSITVSPSTFPLVTASLPYSQTVTAAGGTGPYTYSVTSGSLPSGLTLSPAGLLSGQILSAGAYPFTITATDSGNCTGSQAYTLNVTAPTPALAEWCLILLAASLALAGALILRK